MFSDPDLNKTILYSSDLCVSVPRWLPSRRPCLVRRGQMAREQLAQLAPRANQSRADGGVVLMTLVLVAVMMPCTVVIGMLRRARRRQAERVRDEHDRAIFRFRHT